MLIEKHFAKCTQDDIGKLILRIATAGLILFHGCHKYSVGIPYVKEVVVSSGLLEIVAYVSYLGELIIPVFLILGLFTRTSALILAGNMVFALVLAHYDMFACLDPETGGLMIELPLLYLVPALALFFFGGGKYSIDTLITQGGCPFKQAPN